MLHVEKERSNTSVSEPTAEHVALLRIHLARALKVSNMSIAEMKKPRQFPGEALHSRQ